MEKVREISPDIDLRMITDLLLICAMFFIGVALGQKDIAMVAVIVMFVAYFIRIHMLRRKAIRMLEIEGITAP
jgi:energy-converting hydrogenase Eha subunit C